MNRGKSTPYFIRLILIIVWSFINQKVKAQERPDSFFKKNFASQPSSSKSTNFTELEAPLEENSNKSEIVVTSTVLNSKDIKQAYEVIGFGAVLSGLDVQSLQANINFFADIILKTKSYVEPFYLFGRPEEVMPFFQSIIEKTDPIDRRQALFEIVNRVKLVSRLPDKIPVEKVPSWIVTIKGGTYILEGVSNPELFFTADGKFIIPDKLAGTDRPK